MEKFQCSTVPVSDFILELCDIGSGGTGGGVCTARQMPLLHVCVYICTVGSAQCRGLWTMYRIIIIITPKLLISLISYIVACGTRLVVDTWTHTQDKYSNACCKCTPRVKNDIASCVGVKLTRQYYTATLCKVWPISPRAYNTHQCGFCNSVPSVIGSNTLQTSVSQN